MKGYKATYNMKCESLTYEVGKVYEIDSMRMCSHGFHFCKEAIDTTNYYPPRKDFILLEVEALGEVETVGDKSVTDKIKILRVVPRDEIDFIDWDENDNVIHFKNSDGYEEWEEYDENGNVIHFKNSDGYEKWKEYDENGNMIHFKNSDGYEKWKEYDADGNLIHAKDSRGYEMWW